MKAIRIHKFGGPEVLSYETDAPKPSNLKDNEVLIKVAAAGVNPCDTYIRGGNFVITAELPYTPGLDCAGTVEQIGAKVTKFKTGDRVFTAYRTVSGTYAEYTICEENTIYPLRSKLSFSQGAALGIPYFTAYRALETIGKCKPKEIVLIHGASGAVGIGAIQIAKEMGLVVFGTAGSNEGMKLVKANGAQHVFNHNSDNYCKSIMEATGGKGVNVILEMRSDLNLQKDIEMLPKNGRVLVIGCRGDSKINGQLLINTEGSVIGVGLSKNSEKDWDDAAKMILSGIETGWVNPVVEREYPLAKADLSHVDIINSKATKGKLVLVI